MTAPEVPATQADRLSDAETQRASQALDLVAPLSISSTWDRFERRTIIRAMLAYGDIVNGIAWTEADARIAALEAENARLREGETTEHGLGPHATILDDGDGLMPVAVLRGGNAYIQQGDATIIMSLDVAERLCAALAAPQRTEGA